MAGTYRLTLKLKTLDSNQELRRSERRVLPLHQSSMLRLALRAGERFCLPQAFSSFHTSLIVSPSGVEPAHPKEQIYSLR